LAADLYQFRHAAGTGEEDEVAPAVSSVITFSSPHWRVSASPHARPPLDGRTRTIARPA
jgi:hypothetical protein